AGRFRCASPPAPEVELEGEIEGALGNERALEREQGRAVTERGRVWHGGRPVDGGELVRAGGDELSLGVQDPGRGHPEVVVLGQRGPDQPLEGLVLEERPPREVADRSWLGRRRRIEPAVDGWERHLRPRVVRPDGARGEHARNQRQQESTPHGCSPLNADSTGSGTGSRAGPFARLWRRPSCSTNAKLPGITKTPRKVATSMPQNTAVPMTFCAPAPAPV